MRRSICASAVAGSAAAVFAASAAMAQGYVDTHVHLHPIGLASDMHPGGFADKGGPAEKRTPGGQGMGRQRPGGFPGKAPGGGPGAGPASLASNLAQAADALVARMDALGIGTALIVTVPSPRQSGEETYNSMRQAAARHPSRLKLMVGGSTLNPILQNTPANRVEDNTRQAFLKRAEKELQDGGVGFGEMISYHLCMAPGHSFQYAQADHPLFLALADLAASKGVPIDLHLEAIERQEPLPPNLRRACAANPETLEPTIPALERLLGHNRRANIVWQHIGWDNTGQMTVPLLRRLLAKHPNLYMALRVEQRIMQVGGGGPMPNRLVDRQNQLMPEWRSFITEFPDRLVIGSDEFISPIEGSAKGAASFSLTWSILAQLPPEVALKVGKNNATRLYGLDRR